MTPKINRRSLAALIIASAGVMTFSATAFGQESSTTWDEPQQVQRQAKPKRVYHPTTRNKDSDLKRSSRRC